MHPNKFRYVYVKDSGVTGRLEVDWYSTSNPEVRVGIHSKLKGDGYPQKVWEQFHQNLDKAMANQKQ